MSILSIGELLDLGNSASTAGLVPYSALEYNETGAISGISGSAIAGGVDTTIVSSIASSYVESGISGKVDQTAFDDCCSAMSAIVSAKLDASASSQFQPSGNYQPSGDYYSATNPSGFITTADITGKLDSTASSLFQPSGSYADASSLSGKLDASASGMFAPSGEYAPTGDYAYNSSLSSKLDASASSEFYLTSNQSGFVNSSYVESSISGKQDKLEFGYSGTYISSINGSAIYDTQGSEGVDSATVSAIASSYAESATSGLQPSGNYYSASNPSGFISGITVDSSFTGNGKPGSALGLDKYDLALDQSLYSSLEGNTVTLGVQGGGVQGSYSGIEPIVVDNTANTIGANSLTFLLHSSLSGNLSGSEYTLSVNSSVYAPVQVVSSTALATGTGIVYVVTAS